MQYKPELGVFGNLKLLFSERNQQSRDIYNNNVAATRAIVSAEQALTDMDIRMIISEQERTDMDLRLLELEDKVNGN